MFVANHTSMLDIMLMFYSTKNPFVFVGKKELGKIPLFGYIYKRTCILVDRGNAKSRVEAFRRAEIRLNEGLSVCIFPEGGVPNDLNILLDGEERFSQSFCSKYLKHIQLKTNLEFKTQSTINTQVVRLEIYRGIGIRVELVFKHWLNIKRKFFGQFIVQSQPYVS